MVPIETGGDIVAVAVVADDWWHAKAAVDAMAKDWDAGAWGATDTHAIVSNMRAGLDGRPDEILRQDGNVERGLCFGDAGRRSRLFRALSRARDHGANELHRFGNR